MRKFIICLLLLPAPLLLPVACDRYSAYAPDTVLYNYLDAYYKGRYEVAYDYISSQDRSVRNLKDYLAENKNNASPLADTFAENIAIKIHMISETDAKATAKAVVNLPDIDGMLKELDSKAYSSTSGTVDNQQASRLLAKKYERKEVPTISKQETYQLVREQGVWKIHLDWQAEIVAREREKRIASLLDDARKLRQTGSLQSALEKYAQVLELDSAIILAKQGIVDTKREIREHEEKLEYIKYVSLYDLKAKFYTTYAENKMPGVEFKLKNNGDRLLREIEVTIYFKDISGKTIAEERYHPMLAINKSYSGDHIILKKNYIWQMEDGNFYKADSVPTEWEEGSVSAEITDIKFAE
jgi:hypothetical protein